MRRARAVEDDERVRVARRRRDRLDRLARAGRRLGVDERDGRGPDALDRGAHRVGLEDASPLGVDPRHARAEPRRDVAHALAEDARDADHDVVAGLEEVREAGLHPARAGGG